MPVCCRKWFLGLIVLCFNGRLKITVVNSSLYRIFLHMCTGENFTFARRKEAWSLLWFYLLYTLPLGIILCYLGFIKTSTFMILHCSQLFSWLHKDQHLFVIKKFWNLIINKFIFVCSDLMSYSVHFVNEEVDNYLWKVHSCFKSVLLT